MDTDDTGFPVAGLPSYKIEVFGKESIFYGQNLTQLIVQDLVTTAAPNVRIFVIIADNNVGQCHLPQLLEAFEQQGIGVRKEVNAPATSSARLAHSYLIQPGETSKSIETVTKLTDYLLQLGCNRDTCLIALGGGVVGDLVGFVASIYLRGVSLVQIPTSLLAMVDSSIGGKNGVDTPAGKNLLGSTYEPIRIYIDLKYLSTLPEKEFHNGMIEVIKTCALTSDQQFNALELNLDDIVSHFDEGQEINQVIRQLILDSIKFKASVVTQDKDDRGRRQLLNFGHTVGHALESHFFPHLLHGECVSIGMILEQEIATSMTLGHQSVTERLIRVIDMLEFPVSIQEAHNQVRAQCQARGQGPCPPITVDLLMEKMKLDKKNSNGQIHMALLKEIGVPAEDKAVPVPEQFIRNVLTKELSYLNK